MPLTHIAYCRECKAENAAFTLYGKNIVRRDIRGESMRFSFLFVCNTCSYPRVVHATAPAFNPDQATGLVQRVQGLKILEDLPTDETRVAPEHTPPNIKLYFQQAADNAAAGNPDASAMMSRKTLDVATKQLLADYPGARNRKLARRINWMRDAGMLTAHLARWAHIIRDEGNDAAHEEEPYELPEAEELLEFTEVFLMYVYTIPGRIEEKMTVTVTPETGEIRADGHTPDVETD